MLFKLTQDICSYFNILFVWSVLLIPGEHEKVREEAGGKNVCGAEASEGGLTSGSKRGFRGCLSRFSLSSQPRRSAASSRKPSWISSTWALSTSSQV